MDSSLYKNLEKNIEAMYDDPSLLEDINMLNNVATSIECLNRGEIRVATCKTQGEWIVNAWVKKAILLFFRTSEMTLIESGDLVYHDKIHVRTDHMERNVRVVPPAVCRHGAYVAPGAILMPSYINIGAYVDMGTMVDTWATVGSCAQVGKNVHLSGGVGIGGVLEPPQATPVIIEDNVFIGSRAVVVEGAVIEEGAVLGANVVITASTPIIDVSGSEEKIHRGRVPANSVVIPGLRAKKFPAGTYQVPTALIIGKRTASTDSKTSLEKSLRDYEVQV